MTTGRNQAVDADQGPVVLSWSGGKDSAMTLGALRDSGVEVSALLVTVNGDAGRVSMHGVREGLLRDQARSIGLPLAIARLPQEADNAEYKARFGEALAPWRDAGVRQVAFGDLYLADVRAWRESFMEELRMTARFPLWGHSTRTLVDRFLALDARAWITCVDPAQLDPAFAGCPLDRSTLERFPPGADPAGENGEYHTFVWDGPWLSAPVPCRPGRRVMRGGFAFCELETTAP